MAIDARLVGVSTGSGATAAGSVTAGSTLVFFTTADPAASLTGVSGIGTAVQVDVTRTTAGGSKLYAYAAQNVAGGASVSAVPAWTGTPFAVGFLVEVTGAAAASLDVAVGVNAKTTPFELATGALAQAAECVLAFLANDNGANPVYTPSSPAGLTMLGQNNDSSSWWTGGVAKLVVSSASSVTPAFTLSSGTNVGMIVLSFKEAAGGGGGGGPSITGTSTATPRHLDSLTISGTAFGGTAGTVTLGGVSQSILAWSDTSITIKVDRGTNKYGVTLDVVVTTSGAVASNAFAITSLQPPIGWSFVDVGLLATLNRLPFSPDVDAGDQIAYTNGRGLVTVLPDVTYTLLGGGYVAFDYEAWSPGSGWGTLGRLVVSASNNSNTGQATKHPYALNARFRSLKRKGISTGGLLSGIPRVREGNPVVSLAVLNDQVFASAASSTGVSGTMAAASTATTLSAVAGTQTYNGTVAAAATATALAPPSGTQTYTGALASAPSASALSAVVGTLAVTGSMDAVTTATTLSAVAGTQTYVGVVSTLTSASTEQTVSGTQIYQAAVASMVEGTTLSTLAGTQTYSGAVASEVSATSLAAVAGTQVYQGSTATALTTTVLSAVAGSIVVGPDVAPVSSTTTLSAVAGTQTYQGATDSLASASLLSTVGGTETSSGSTTSLASATSLQAPAGTQVYQGSVSSLSTDTALAGAAGTQGSTGTVAAESSTTTLQAVAGTQVYQGSVADSTSALVLAAPAGTQIYVGATAAASSGTVLGSIGAGSTYTGSMASAATGTQLLVLAGTYTPGAGAAPVAHTLRLAMPNRAFRRAPSDNALTCPRSNRTLRVNPFA